MIVLTIVLIDGPSLPLVPLIVVKRNRICGGRNEPVVVIERSLTQPLLSRRNSERDAVVFL